MIDFACRVVVCTVLSIDGDFRPVQVCLHMYLVVVGIGNENRVLGFKWRQFFFFF